MESVGEVRVVVTRNGVDNANPVNKAFYSTKNKYLMTGAVVMYKGIKMVVREVREDYAVQLMSINTDGTLENFSGTPHVDKVTEVIGNFALAMYNNTFYFVTHKEQIYSAASGKECYKIRDNQRKTILQKAHDFAISHGWVK